MDRLTICRLVFAGVALPFATLITVTLLALALRDGNAAGWWGAYAGHLNGGVWLGHWAGDWGIELWGRPGIFHGDY